jgi:CheY-like chemotaxis protein
VVVAVHPELFEPLITQAGYEIAGVSHVAVNGERLAAHLRPDVIVVENELPGVQGWEALGHLKAASPRSQILLVVAEEWQPSDLGSIDAFAVVTRRHLEVLVGQLTDLDEWIADQTRVGVDVRERRHRDRRRRQDWSKVGFEKRLADDRRVAVPA